METKIPFYNLINIFLLGLLFLASMLYITFPSWIKIIAYHELLVQWQFLFSVLLFGVIYEVGVIINRFSSVVIENVCEKIGLISEISKNYTAFNSAKKDNPFLATLSREYAFSRGNFTLWILLAIIFFCNKYCLEGICSLLLSTLFFFSMRKFDSKIQNILKDYSHEQK